MFVQSSIFLIGLVTSLMAVSAQEPTPVSVRGAAGFGQAERVLRELVTAKRGGPTNSFCVVGYKDASDATTAWVHWVEGRALILWEPSNPPTPLVESRRYLDLTRDVVPSEKQLKGSSYLVTKSWVDGVLADCKRIGDRYVLGGSPPRRK
jgi:hypothetical protein